MNKKIIFAGIAVLVLVIILMIFAVTRLTGTAGDKKAAQKEKVAATVGKAVQILPNYSFGEGVDYLKIPVIPTGHIIPREAGGWVIIPPGVLFDVHYNTPITVERLSGKTTHHLPGIPSWEGIDIENRYLRIYGNEGQYAEVRIKRGVY